MSRQSRPLRTFSAVEVQCPSSRKSKRSAAGWSRPWSARVSARSNSGGRTCALRCPRASPRASRAAPFSASGGGPNIFLPISAGGDVLVMHLGMSGSFRIETQAGAGMPGEFHHPRSKASAHDHYVFEMSNGARITYNDPRRFGFMLIVKRAELDDHRCSGHGRRTARPRTRRRAAGAAFRRQDGAAQGRTARPAAYRRLGNVSCARRYTAPVCRRAAPRERSRAATAPDRARACLAEIDSADPARSDRGGRVVAARPPPDRRDAGLFPASFRVYHREGAPCLTPGCRGTVEAPSCNRGDRPSFVALARSRAARGEGARTPTGGGKHGGSHQSPHRAHRGRCRAGPRRTQAQAQGQSQGQAQRKGRAQRRSPRRFSPCRR